MALTFQEVADILKLIDASDCEEVVLELEGIKLSVRRGGGSASGAAFAPASAITEMGQENNSRATGDGKPDASTPATEPASGYAVKSPMVGTFYRAPSPGKPPFVETGARIAAGDPLCLVEVMKLYTTIEAPLNGTVRQVVAEDGALVEFDQLLFVIDPD